MALSMWGLFFGLLRSVAFGAFLHLFYDAGRVLRILCGERQGSALLLSLERIRFPGLSRRPARRAGRFFVAAVRCVTDLLFAVSCGFFFSLFVYWQNDGIFRLLFLLGAVLGFFLCHVSLGRLLLAAAEGVAFFLRVAMGYLCLLVRLPALFLFRLLRSLFLFLYAHGCLPLYHRRAVKKCDSRIFPDLLP